jgi:hypothetical protein
MKKGVMTCLALLAGALALAGWVPAPVLAGPHTVPGQGIVDWNGIASQHLSGSTLADIREFAILHVAIYDAVVSLTRDHQPYHFAAHTVLVTFHPGQCDAVGDRGGGPVPAKASARPRQSQVYS